MQVKFTPVSDSEKEFADKSTSIADQHSPFHHGLTFQITGWSYSHRDGDLTRKDHPYFITTLGNLYLSAITAEKIAYNGEPVINDGNFNKIVQEIVNKHVRAHDENGVTMKDVCDTFKDKTVVCRRVGYNAISRSGDIYPSSILCLDV